MDKTVKHARNLRQNLTDAEKCIWAKLRNRRFHDVKFRRQHPIPPYIVDFFSEELKLVIELDGGQHSPEQDLKRQSFIEEQGITVLRFWNNDVLRNLEGVLQDIERYIPSPTAANPSTLRSDAEASLPSPAGRDICIGVIASVHGLKGLVKILPYCEDPALLEQVAEHDITLKNPMGKHILAEIAGVHSREDAEAIKGTELFIPRDALPEPDEGEYYIEDLVGLRAIGEDGADIGIVLAVYNFGAGDLVEIKPDAGESFLIPFNDDTIANVENEITIKNHENYQ